MKNPRRGKSAAIAALWLGLVAPLGASAAGPAAGDEYRLGPGDVIEVEVIGESDLSGRFPLDGNGQVRIGWLPAVLASERTVEQLEKELTDFLGRKYLRQPRVRIKVAEYKSKGVKLLGALAKPGLYQLGANPSLLKMVWEAGGPTSGAGREILVMRFGRGDGPAGDKVKTFKIESSRLFKGGDASADINLENGDVVYLQSGEEASQQKGGDSVFIFGAAQRPGAYPYRAGYTLLDAVSDCQGFTKFASPSRARIVRKSKDGKEETIRVNLNELMKEGAKGKKIDLQPNDIIYIPESVL